MEGEKGEERRGSLDGLCVSLAAMLIPDELGSRDKARSVCLDSVWFEMGIDWGWDFTVQSAHLLGLSWPGIILDSRNAFHPVT